MVKRTTKETILEYDSSGKLIKETITETTEENDGINNPIQYPCSPSITLLESPWWGTIQYCDISNSLE